jgi:hypothetical protein
MKTIGRNLQAVKYFHGRAMPRAGIKWRRKKVFYGVNACCVAASFVISVSSIHTNL